MSYFMYSLIHLFGIYQGKQWREKQKDNQDIAPIFMDLF